MYTNDVVHVYQCIHNNSVALCMYTGTSVRGIVWDRLCRPVWDRVCTPVWHNIPIVTPVLVWHRIYLCTSVIQFSIA